MKHGANKVMFGTNYPMILPKKALDGLEGLELENNTLQQFLAGNAKQVFGLS